MTSKIAVIQFPGSNCEREAILAVTRAGMQAVPFLWNEPADKLAACDGFVISGGFSYEDRSRAGIIASLEPVLETLKAQAKTGKPVMGICNGAQVLVETGLVPGAENDALSMALTINKRMKGDSVLGAGYYNAWINLCTGEGVTKNAFNRLLSADTVLRMPVAHAEGRYVMPEATLQALKENGQIAFQYCDGAANVVDEFPVNPNGSMANIAGVTNAAGNVLSLMPHPERIAECDVLFESMRDYIEEGNYPAQKTIAIDPVIPSIEKYEPETKTTTFVIDLLITDKEAVSVQNALNLVGIPVTVSRQTHWEISASDVDTARRQVIDSGELFNVNKESLVDAATAPNTQSLLVRHKEDVTGMNKRQHLTHHFGVKGIDAIAHGSLWHITAKEGEDIKALMPRVLATNILFNPFGQAGQFFE